MIIGIIVIRTSFLKCYSYQNCYQIGEMIMTRTLREGKLNHANNQEEGAFSGRFCRTKNLGADPSQIE